MNIITTYSLRPNRILFYMNPSLEDIDNYYNGIIPEKVSKYNGAFGTYGHPALFIINKDDVKLKVIGIEFRPEDNRISYPEDLEKILISDTYFRSDVLVEEIDDTLNEESILNHVNKVCTGELTSHKYLFGDLTVMKEPEVVQVYMFNDHSQVMISADYVQDIHEDEDADQASSYYKYLYYHDAMTGGYNWNYIWPRMSDYNLYGVQDYAFVIFDIKDFKNVNVVYGHAEGNMLLTNIAKKLEKLDWVYYSARCDNDNFAVMIKDMTEEETTEKLELFFDSVSYLENHKNYKVYYRCGVVPMKCTVEMGMTVADAGKQAKAFGTKSFKTEIIYFTDDMQEEQERSIRLRNYLDTAIERDEFLVYLQPKYDIHTEKIKGGEALIRWKYKGRSMLSPGIFVPLFESDGLISKLDDIVLKKVCIQLKEWKKQGKRLYPISVNVSRKSVGIPGLVDHLTDIVDSVGIDHNLIDFELTESAAYDNQDYMLDVLKQLKERGFRMSMDDFGTGYSSLSLLPIMPFDTMKIDKSFVDRIGRSEDNAKSNAVVEEIIALAKKLDMTCLAEGAEEKEQVDLLREYGCEVIQGYYYSRPLPIEDYEKLL